MTETLASTAPGYYRVLWEGRTVFFGWAYSPCDARKRAAQEKPAFNLFADELQPERLTYGPMINPDAD